MKKISFGLTFGVALCFSTLFSSSGWAAHTGSKKVRTTSDSPFGLASTQCRKAIQSVGILDNNGFPHDPEDGFYLQGLDKRLYIFRQSGIYRVTSIGLPEDTTNAHYDYGLSSSQQNFMIAAKNFPRAKRDLLITRSYRSDATPAFTLIIRELDPDTDRSKFREDLSIMSIGEKSPDSTAERLFEAKRAFHLYVTKCFNELVSIVDSLNANKDKINGATLKLKELGWPDKWSEKLINRLEPCKSTVLWEESQSPLLKLEEQLKMLTAAPN